MTQAHKYKDFTFTTFSPVAFRYFREEFQIKAEDYLVSYSLLCLQQTFPSSWHYVINLWESYLTQEQVVHFFIFQPMMNLLSRQFRRKKLIFCRSYFLAITWWVNHVCVYLYYVFGTNLLYFDSYLTLSLSLFLLELDSKQKNFTSKVFWPVPIQGKTIYCLNLGLAFPEEGCLKFNSLSSSSWGVVSLKHFYSHRLINDIILIAYFNIMCLVHNLLLLPVYELLFCLSWCHIFILLQHSQCGGIKIRIVVMNNLLPSSLHYHWKFDLKGSTYKRRASQIELKKKSPTFKDIDFMNNLPEVS